ncbi:hypothetical protein QA338_04025 [Glaesserella parasuis]|uniref:glycosyltransferase n=1 Tax=Glaesserella parasuis TaxID=738 RepID=UPI0024370D9B|nr:glycosyltransferase [Glaesserella parasuis]MDG6771201.1 hypothetical protein [Glaesserella parasuis]MDO9873322.1 hypothetical protein [Glaesserella parasuis]
MNLTVEVNEPIIDFSYFNNEYREEGLSGFIRAKNEGEFLADAIESWLPLLDELIIVFNDCQDNTEEVAEEYARRYPDKIKVFHYLPIVYPQGSSMYKSLDERDFHSLVHYYNFALSKTTKKWAVKIDGDLLLVPEMVSTLRDKYNDMCKNGIDNYLPVSGVNVILENDEFYVPSSSKFCGTNGDLCIFRVDVDSIFKKNKETEYLDLSNRKKLENIFAYYHLKFIKSDYGLGNYDFKSNPRSRYLPKTIIFLLTTHLIKLDYFIRINKQNSNGLNVFSIDLLMDLKSKMESRFSYKKQALKYLDISYKDIYIKEFLQEAKLYCLCEIINSSLYKKLKSYPHLMKFIRLLRG